MQTSFVDDNKEHEEKIYYDNGNLEFINIYKNGKLHGLCKQWNRNRVLVFEGEYFEGKKHGKFNKYYDNGNPRVLQTFHHDTLHGMKRSYNEDKLVSEQLYDMGEKML